MGCLKRSPGLVWQKIQEPLTQGSNMVGVEGVNEFQNILQKLLFGQGRIKKSLGDVMVAAKYYDVFKLSMYM